MIIIPPPGLYCQVYMLNFALGDTNFVISSKPIFNASLASISGSFGIIINIFIFGLLFGIKNFLL